LYIRALFIAGVSFCYFVLCFALAASQVYSNWLGFSATSGRRGYISFVCKFMLAWGWDSRCRDHPGVVRSGFELPHPFQGRKYMIVINLCWARCDDARGADPGVMALPLQYYMK